MVPQTKNPPTHFFYPPMRGVGRWVKNTHPEPKNHSLTRLLTLAHANLDIFSRDALAARKRKLSPNADDWLYEYLNTAYVPTREDFRKLKQLVAIRRKTYEEKYRPLRHQVFAHRAVSTPAQVDELFAKINLREIRQMLVFLESSYLRTSVLLPEIGGYFHWHL